MSVMNVVISGGFGRTIARRFADQGATVVDPASVRHCFIRSFHFEPMS